MPNWNIVMIIAVSVVAVAAVEIYRWSAPTRNRRWICREPRPIKVMVKIFPFHESVDDARWRLLVDEMVAQLHELGLLIYFPPEALAEALWRKGRWHDDLPVIKGEDGDERARYVIVGEVCTADAFAFRLYHRNGAPDRKGDTRLTFKRAGGQDRATQMADAVLAGIRRADWRCLDRPAFDYDTGAPYPGSGR